MNNRPDFTSGFVAHLRRLHAQDDRAALARLRRGLGKGPATATEMHPLVLPWLPRGLTTDQEDACYLIASLFATHPEPGGEESLGSALARLKDGPGGDSLEKRFVALLNCHEDDLPGHLRHAVSLLRSRGVSVGWEGLLADVLAWGRPGRSVQRRWARDYWGPTAAHDDQAAGTDTDNPT
jgi:CRISPR system Cascade subunit CasB